MIQCNIIGKGFLDMDDGGGIAFKKENQYFRFCDIGMGRSTEFSVPATEGNRLLFGYADVMTSYGEMLRKVHECQMIYDGRPIMGTLSVTSFEGDSFKCVFQIGNTSWLEALQNRKLKDCGVDWSGLLWDTSSTVWDANLADPTARQLIIKYDNGFAVQPANWQRLPSVNVRYYIDDIMSAMGVPFTNNIPLKYWMVSPSINGGSEETITLASTGTNNAGVSPNVNGYLSVVDVTLRYARSLFFGNPIGGSTVAAKAFKAEKDIAITFPSGMPVNCYLVIYSTSFAQYRTLGGISTTGIGEKLDGRTFEISKGQIFFFAPNVFFDPQRLPYNYGYQDTFNPFSFTVSIERDGELTIGENWYLRDNHPDMTVFEFLRSIALATGLELHVDENGVEIGFNNMSGHYSPDKVVSIDVVTRRVGCWGDNTRKGVIDFDSEEYVTDRIAVSYDIDNEQLQEDSFHTIKMSEGNVGSNGIVIKDVDTSGGSPKAVATRWTLAIADQYTANAWMQRIPQFDHPAYRDIGDNATCVKMKAAATLADFFGLLPNTAITYRGGLFVWTDADWCDGIMGLTLQRVSQIY